MAVGFRIDDGGVGSQLDAIRERIGAEAVSITIDVDAMPTKIVGIDLSDARDLRAIFHPSGVLVADNQVVLVYIRDHTVGGPYDTPWNRKRVHFGVCKKLEEMKATGRIRRYRATNRLDDIYDIDTEHGKEEVELYPCQYCLGLFKFKGYSYDLPRTKKNSLVRNFRAAEALRFTNSIWGWALSDLSKGLKDASSSTAYALEWTRISLEVRRSAGFTCSRCGVTLRHEASLLDVHHVNGDKSDNSMPNLVCLCVSCHRGQPEHEHYQVTDREIEAIDAARKEQGVKAPPEGATRYRVFESALKD